MSELVTPRQPRRLMPVDSLGMPYGIAPAPVPTDQHSIELSEHHGFYTRRAPQLRDPMGRVVRLSRTHDLESWQHIEFHNQFPGGLESFPETDQAKFDLALLALSGYLPREGMVMDNDRAFHLQELTDGQYRFMRSRYRMHPQTRSSTRKLTPHGCERSTNSSYTYIGPVVTEFIVDNYLVSDFAEQAEAMINDHDRDRRHKIGRRLLEAAVYNAVEGIKPVFNDLKRNGLIRVGEAHPAEVVLKRMLKSSWGKKERIIREALQNRGESGIITPVNN